MSQRVVIPKTIEAATKELNGLGALLTAKNWARAAIVWAFVEPDRQGARHDLTSRESAKLTPTAFAKRGIVGLSVREDVDYYRKAWQTAIDDGQAKEVTPGQSVDLPDRAWPPSPRARKTKDVISSGIRNQPEEFAKALKDPEVSEQVAQVLADESGHVTLHRAESKVVDTVEHVTPAKAGGPDYSDKLRLGVNAIMPALHAYRDGNWEPDVMERTLASMLSDAFRELAGETRSEGDLFTEIDAFLAQVTP